MMGRFCSDLEETSIIVDIVSTFDCERSEFESLKFTLALLLSKIIKIKIICAIVF